MCEPCSYVFSSRRYFVLSGSNLSYYNTKGEREARDNMVLTAGSVVTEVKTKGTCYMAYCTLHIHT